MSDFADKVRTIQLSRGRGTPRTQVGRDPDGNRFRATTDELGNTVTEWDDHQDVTIRAQSVTTKANAGN
jgi:hypothetical protein